MQVTTNPMAFEAGETTPDEFGVVPTRKVVTDVDFRMSSMMSLNQNNGEAKKSRIVVHNKNSIQFDFFVRVVKESDEQSFNIMISETIGPTRRSGVGFANIMLSLVLCMICCGCLCRLSRICCRKIFGP